MTRAERLRAAAAAEQLADWVRVSQHNYVYLRRDENYATQFLFEVRKLPKSYMTRGRLWVYWRPPGVGGQIADGSSYPTRDAAIRAGLIALAEREGRA